MKEYNDNKNKHNIFISYCWTDGNEYADELEKALRNTLTVYRDKSSLNCSDDMYEFMYRISECDNVALVVTHNYLYSENCMMEMSYLLEQADWLSKSTILVIDNGVYKLDKQIELIKYWRKSLKDLETAKRNSDFESELLNEKIERIRSINEVMERFIEDVKNHKSPSQIAVVQEIIKKADAREKRAEQKKLVSKGEAFVKEYLKQHGDAPISEISEAGNMTRSATQRYIQKLIDNGEISRVGSRKNGRFEVNSLAM